jgi:transcriptional regulator of acetoin/glycerol metabolism
VRELGALAADLVARCRSSALELQDVTEYIARQTGVRPDDPTAETRSHFPVPYEGDFPKLKDVEEFLVGEAMTRAEGNLYRAAELLGVAQSTLWRRFKKE